MESLLKKIIAIIKINILILASYTSSAQATTTFVDAFSLVGQEDDVTGFSFNDDGSKMFVVGTTGDDVNEYTLPGEIIEVRQVYRRNVGSRLGGLGNTGSGNPIYTQTITATAGQTVLDINYNFTSVARIEVYVNNAVTTNYSEDSTKRQLTMISPLNANDIVNVSL